MLDWILCCLRSQDKPSSQHVIDENSRLIPPSIVDEQPTGHPQFSYNQTIMKDRLGTIVRAKEGKMINVGTPLPFNLHHTARRSGSSRDGARTSSGGSGSMPPPSHRYHEHDNNDEHEHERDPASANRLHFHPNSSRASSPSFPPPSSSSMTSLHPPGSDFHEHEQDDGEFNGNGRPVLNIRLVEGRGRRRRSKGVRKPSEEDDGSHVAENGVGLSVENSSSLEDRRNVYATPPLEGEPFSPTDTDDTPTELRKDFKIKEVGVLARSFRD